MKRILLVVVWQGILAGAAMADEGTISNVVLGIHGGLARAKSEVSEERQKAVRAEMERALKAGYDVLQKPEATGLDAVEAAIRVMEDSPLFNAGKGAVFTHDGRNELDASIMEGKTKRAGAVAGVTTVKNPITAARAVMERTRHVLLISKGAEVWAANAGLETVDPKYFHTEERWQQLQKELERERKAAGNKGAQLAPPPKYGEWSTVGAVARDKAGNLAAGTSTGGMSNKQYGRVGDSPIIAAGTYADNETCAVSCTGHGEYFIRFAVSHDIHALMAYKGMPVQAAVEEVVLRKLKPAGGEGGVIALDNKGRFTASHNSDGIYRGSITADGKITIVLYDE
jgi:L-asparaginase / beta-aspartyl-peptidase